MTTVKRLIYLDFQKAFDKVPHKRLLIHGIQDNILEWVENWLNNRKQSSNKWKKNPNEPT